MCILHNLKVMNLRNLLTNDASYKNLFMDLRKLKKLEYSF